MTTAVMEEKNIVGPGSRVAPRRSAGTARAKDMRAGFTLIELLVVIAIIGLLSTIAVAGTNYVRTRARDTRRVADVGTMQKALALYLANTGLYPVSAAGTCLTNSDPVSVALKSGATPVMTSVPSDPSSPTTPPACFFYTSADGSTYAINYTLEVNSSVGTAGLHTAIPE